MFGNERATLKTSVSVNFYATKLNMVTTTKRFWL